ncbi:MAG: hypothetical protein KDK91_24320 [Gammaproteobacteria bacterium]|nr:hypothetical protein [Gammaproteobacteria bacterium]
MHPHDHLSAAGNEAPGAASNAHTNAAAEPPPAAAAGSPDASETDAWETLLAAGNAARRALDALRASILALRDLLVAESTLAAASVPVIVVCVLVGGLALLSAWLLAQAGLLLALHATGLSVLGAVGCLVVLNLLLVAGAFTYALRLSHNLTLPRSRSALVALLQGSET